MDNEAPKTESRWERMINKIMRLWDYVSVGLWNDNRRTWWLNILKTINLSVTSFLNRDIQTQASAMTYRTMLAVVPALALLLAIGRGFGFQSVLQDELFHYFPAQEVAIRYALNFVDAYLTTASEGIFVGVGIVFLLWTLISLISNVEDTFNLIWGVRSGRSLWRKLSDYTAMLLILPVLMICASGVSLLISSTIDSIFHLHFLTPLISILLECASWIMTWLFFTAVYMLIPYTKVKFKYALISGILAGTGFMVLQWLFVTGTLYVTRYNAIYGSFAFLPLMLLWLQLVWMIILAGAVVCYSSQNVFAFSLDRQVGNISPRYRAKVLLAIAATLTQRLIAGKTAATARDLMDIYDLPARLVTSVTDILEETNIVSKVLIPGRSDVYGYQLAVDPGTITLEELFKKAYSVGNTDFIPDFDTNFPGVVQAFNTTGDATAKVTSTIYLKDIEIRDVLFEAPSQNTNVL